jgi:CheY-like chemotaxis protein
VAVSRSVLVVDDDAVFCRLTGDVRSGWRHVVVGETASGRALGRLIEDA